MNKPTSYLFLLILCLLHVACIAQKKQTPAWEMLFDGNEVSKWRGINSNDFPSASWAIIDHELRTIPGKTFADIITKEKYSDFELELEFNLSELANTGIKYFVQLGVKPGSSKITGIGPEYQLIDDFNHPEFKGSNTHPESSTAAMYLLYPPVDKVMLPLGKWNTAKIIAKGKHVEHWLNGKKVVSYERGSADFKALVAKRKFKDIPNFGEDAEGYILLQSMGDKASFRNIRIRKL